MPAGLLRPAVFLRGRVAGRHRTRALLLIFDDLDKSRTRKSLDNRQKRTLGSSAAFNQDTSRSGRTITPRPRHAPSRPLRKERQCCATAYGQSSATRAIKNDCKTIPTDLPMIYGVISSECGLSFAVSRPYMIDSSTVTAIWLPMSSNRARASPSIWRRLSGAMASQAGVRRCASQAARIAAKAWSGDPSGIVASAGPIGSSP